MAENNPSMFKLVTRFITSIWEFKDGIVEGKAYLTGHEKVRPVAVLQVPPVTDSLTFNASHYHPTLALAAAAASSAEPPYRPAPVPSDAPAGALPAAAARPRC
jgi:hypothetical protein